jgi:hypothetical protein
MAGDVNHLEHGCHTADGRAASNSSFFCGARVLNELCGEACLWLLVADIGGISSDPIVGAVREARLDEIRGCHAGAMRYAFSWPGYGFFQDTHMYDLYVESYESQRERSAYEMRSLTQYANDCICRCRRRRRRSSLSVPSLVSLVHPRTYLLVVTSMG